MKLIINGQEIPQAFFEQRLQEIYPEVQQRRGDKPPAIIELSARDEARERVIEEALIEQEIDRVNPPADEALVQQELKKMLKKQETKRQLKQAGRNREIVINNMRKQLYRRLQAYEIMEAAMHQDPASDEDVEEFYNKNLNHFKTLEQIHASHILIRDKSDIGREKLDAVIEALDSGRDFQELAREFSEDTSSEQGGDLGWLPRGQTVAKFEKVAFSLELDEISDPFETQFGWHIVRLHERQDARTQSLEEVSEQIAMMLLRERRNESYRLFLQDLKEKATIEEVKP